MLRGSLTLFGSLQSAARSNAHALLFFVYLFFPPSFQIGLTDVQLASILNKRAAIHQERKNLAHCESMIRELRVAAGSHLRSLHHTMDDIQSQRTHQLTRCTHMSCGLNAMVGRAVWVGCIGTLTDADFLLRCRCCCSSSSGVMTPTQLAKFCMWVESNEWTMQMLNSYMFTSSSAKAQQQP